MTRKTYSHYRWTVPPPISIPTGGRSPVAPAQGSATSKEGATTPCYCTMFFVISTPR
jgi:hypothetical protein